MTTAGAHFSAGVGTTRCFAERSGSIHPANREEHTGFCIDEQPLFTGVTINQWKAGLLGSEPESKRYGLTIKLTAHGKSPLRDTKVAAFIGSTSLPTAMTTNSEGILPAIETNHPERVESDLLWETYKCRQDRMIMKGVAKSEY
ncbi:MULTISPECIES: hypothetical protein [unclassified Pseudomonas]|uniref:hypothetical protein n=1 Tax=unclassified Pseudomonas TaxID=196821 RepID=UPI001EE6637B|nr:hypothetical protein [Pseudomonas sp. M47T1]